MLKEKYGGEMKENSTSRNMLLATALVFKVSTEALGPIVSSKYQRELEEH